MRSLPCRPSLRRPCHSSAKRPRRILTLCLGGIGDTVLSLAALRDLRRACPNDHLTALTMWPQSADLIRDLGIFDEVLQHNFQCDHWWRSFWAMLKLRYRHFDVSLLAFPANRFEYNALSYLLGSERRLGHTYLRGGDFANLRFLLTDRIDQQAGRHVVDENRALVARFTGHASVGPADIRLGPLDPKYHRAAARMQGFDSLQASMPRVLILPGRSRFQKGATTVLSPSIRRKSSMKIELVHDRKYHHSRKLAKAGSDRHREVPLKDDFRRLRSARLQAAPQGDSTMKLARCCIGLVFALVTVPVQGGIIVDHQPGQTGGGAADTEFINMSGNPSWQQVADNFSLPIPSQPIRRVGVWAFYNENTPPASETLRVRFYDARPADGLPGNILFEESFLNPSRVPTGNPIGGAQFDEYFFQVDLSLAILLEANTTYWLEVVQVGDINSAFRWEFGFGDLDGLAFINPFTGDDWQLTAFNADNAFQLSTIPEPSVLGLLLLGAMLVGRRRSRREVRRVDHRV